jgi:hypothetical protein
MGILYGLPKIHKPNVPIRPILSALNTVGYKISTFLVPLINPVTTNSFTVKDTFQFVNEICNTENADNYIMASFDVESLFTNIPLDETISIITNNLFSKCSTVSGLNKQQFQSLLELSVKNTQFVFNGSLFEQIDGVGMGLPLGPTMANAFMSHYEKIWLENCPSDFKPKLYRRYVDDTFLLFSSRDHVQKFLDYLNAQHANIRFTSETEVDNELAFLDVLISRTDNGFATSVYRKPTFTGQFMNYNSFLFGDYKINLIQCLLYRSFKICSNFNLLRSEVGYTTRLLQQNQFPLSTIQSTIKKWFDKQLSLAPKVATVPRRLIYFSLPYTGYHGLQLRNKLSRLLQKNFPQANVRIIFKSGCSIRSLFRVKEKLPFAMRSHVVYSFNCNCCSAVYYGETNRHILVRAHEHLGTSFRTGRQLTVNNPTSAVLRHLRSENHTASFSDFKILASANTHWDLLLKEALLIQRDRPILNNQTTSVPLSLF